MPDTKFPKLSFGRTGNTTFQVRDGGDCIGIAAMTESGFVAWRNGKNLGTFDTKEAAGRAMQEAEAAELQARRAG